MVCLPIFSVLVLIDWATKIAVQFSMDQGEIRNFLPHFLKLNYMINPGSAYGANASNAGLAIGLATLVTMIALVIFIFANDKKWLVAIVFILSGSFANLLARAWAPVVSGGDHQGQKGGVIDFLVWDFNILNSGNYVFNIADFWVNIGVIILIIDLIIEIILYFNTAYHQKHLNEFQDVENHLLKRIKTINQKVNSSEPSLVIDDKPVVSIKDELLTTNTSKKEQQAAQKLQKMREKQNGKNNSN